MRMARPRMVVSVVVALLLLSAWGSAEAQMRPASAEIVRATGRVDVLPKGQTAWVAGTVGARLVEGDQVRALAGGGARRVDVVCPGFAVDCLETLEEIAMLNAHAFHDAGGEALRYIPCLNATPAHADALAALAQRELAAW